nr:T-cell receptor delta chain variable region {NuVD2.5, VDJ junction} [nude mice, bone marrow, Peptide Partial, 15 aa] [Mus musculus]
GGKGGAIGGIRATDK